MIMFISLSLSAQTKYYSTVTYMSRLLPYGEWSTVKYVEIPISINLTTKHIEIYSKEPQVIDYTGFTKYEDVLFTAYGSPASDRSYKSMYVTLYSYFNDDVVLEITYSDVEYRYRLQ